MIFRCLLDVMSVALVDMDIYSAEYVKEKDYRPSADPTSDLVFSSFVVIRQVGNHASPLRQTQTETYLSARVNPFTITARELSCGQGNIFTGVCPQGEGVSLPSLGQRPSPPDKDPLDRDPPPRTVKSGRCASYWNVFL